MGIRVECPHGHHFKVKDKYAGKRGLCPHCKGQVVVHVPHIDAGKSLPLAAEQAYRNAVISEHKAAHAAPPPTGSSSSVFDDEPVAQDSSTSGSLLGSSVIRHNIKCSCGTSVPMWYAKCPSCGKFLENR
ncbi:MAG: hypothetical protein AAF589_04600 [Planctomycetota bacterium]